MDSGLCAKKTKKGKNTADSAVPSNKQNQGHKEQDMDDYDNLDLGNAGSFVENGIELAQCPLPSFELSAEVVGNSVPPAVATVGIQNMAETVYTASGIDAYGGSAFTGVHEDSYADDAPLPPSCSFANVKSEPLAVKSEPLDPPSSTWFIDTHPTCNLCQLTGHLDIDCVLHQVKRETTGLSSAEESGDEAFDLVRIVYFKNSDGKGDDFSTTATVGMKMEPAPDTEDEAEDAESGGESGGDSLALPELLNTLRKRGTIRYTWVARERLYLVSLTAALNTVKVEKIDSKLTLTRFLRENGIRLYYVGKKFGHDAKSS